MTSEIWIALLIFNKFLVYLGIAAAIGGSASMLLFTRFDVIASRASTVRLWQKQVCKYALILMGLGFTANVADFFVQTGNLSEDGLKGMFEPIMLEMMWVSSVGTLTLVRALSLALAMLMVLYALLLRTSLNTVPKLIGFGLATLLIISALSYSFTLSGHTNSLELGSVTLISLHVAMAFAWLGALIPLIYACYHFNNSELYLLMHRFGSYAVWGVSILLLAGIAMLIQLLPSLDALLFSNYGQLFMLKVGFVLVLLLFAMLHKFVLVPRLLQQANGHTKLRHSIMAEAFIGLLVLITTSVVTTAVGPPI